MLSQFTNKSQEKFDGSKLCHLKLSMAFNLYPVWLHMWMWYYDLSVSRSNSKEATTAGKNNNNSQVSHTNHTKEANELMDQETHHHEKTETLPPVSDYNQSPPDYSWSLPWLLSAANVFATVAGWTGKEVIISHRITHDSPSLSLLPPPPPPTAPPPLWGIYSNSQWPLLHTRVCKSTSTCPT